MEKKLNNQDYREKFEEVFEEIKNDNPSLCGYFLFGSLSKGSDSPSDIDAIYLYDSEIGDINSQKKIQFLDDLEIKCNNSIGIPINRYDPTIYDESESAFADISGEDFKTKIGYLINYFPNLKLDDFRLNEKSKKKLEKILFN